MFSIERFEVIHWDWWERFSVPLDAGIVTVVGPNGSGKTTLLDALRTVLAIDCSAGRDYKRYVRRSDRPYAWLRLVVANRRNARGQLAFWPLTTERVTLVCHIRKKGGDWERRYGIGGDDVPIEHADDSQAITWFGVRQYAAQLENAGLTRAIKRVLALDQGNTDKLCEYSGRQLLDLVFDVFGDREVLDNYQRAREEQAGVAKELEALKVQLAGLGLHVQEVEAEVRSFNEWQRLVDEATALQAEWVPRLRIAELHDAVRGGRSQFEGLRRDLENKREALIKGTERAARANAALDSAGVRQKELDDQLSKAQLTLETAREPEREAESLLKEKTRLLDLLKVRSSEHDLAVLGERASALRQQLADWQKRTRELQGESEVLRAQLAAMESGRMPEPQDVAAFRDVLKQAGIAHRTLSEIVAIDDDTWQLAAESVLRPYRHILLLATASDEARALTLGEQHGYRHFLVPDHEPAPIARADSLLRCLRFTAHAPGWLLRLLNDVRCVESAEEGAKLPKGQHWITRSGYERERRGGRSIATKDLHFGRAAAEQIRRKLERIDAELQSIPAQRASLAAELSRIEPILSGFDAARQLADRAAEFEEADRMLPDLRSRRELAAAHWQRLDDEIKEDIRAREGLIREDTEAKTLLKPIEEAVRELTGRIGSSQREHLERIAALRGAWHRKPGHWRTKPAREEATAKYATTSEAERELTRLQNRLKDESFVRDPLVTERRDKLKADHDQLAERIEQQGGQLESARSTTDRARDQYIGVLRATMRLYARNVQKLGDLAGIKVEVRYPHLANDDLSLAQAALEVLFDFDQKGLIGLNDGEASGGQQVMKSMILLVGLMMEGDEGGGFVFIDEPFAHLDIFNIDKVGAFLQATRAQYIVTTPNTHNVNVFKPSDLTLLTQKRLPGKGFAPPVAFLRRAKSA